MTDISPFDLNQFGNFETIDAHLAVSSFRLYLTSIKIWSIEPGLQDMTSSSTCVLAHLVHHYSYGDINSDCTSEKLTNIQFG